MKTIIAILALSFVLIGCSDSKESAGFTKGVVTSVGEYDFRHSNYYVLVDTTGNGVTDISCRSDFAKVSFGHFRNNGVIGREVDVEIFLDTVTCQYEYVAHLRDHPRATYSKKDAEM